MQFLAELQKQKQIYADSKPKLLFVNKT